MRGGRRPSHPSLHNQGIGIFIPFTILCMTLLSPLVSLAEASGGGLLFDSSTLSIQGNMGVGAGDVNISVEVKSHDIGTNGSINISLIAGESEVVSFQNSSLNMTFNEISVIHFNITSLPVGQYTLTVLLFGDVGIPFGNNMSQLNQFVKRLAPADPTLLASSTWSATPVDGESAEASGNATFRDGDAGWLLVPVENRGEVNWSGQISLSVDSGQPMGLNITVSALATSQANFSLPQLTESTAVSLEVNLSGQVATLNISVGPPPLPTLVLSGDADFSSPSLGDEVNWTMNISNSGEKDWDGSLVCTFSGSQIADEQFLVGVGQTLSHSFTLSVRPGELSCWLAAGQRVAAESQLSLNYSYDMDAAHFTPASSIGLVFDGGGLHVGDTLHASLIVHNGGDLAGNAKLVITDSAQVSQGISRTYQVGESLQVEAEHQLIGSAGNRTIQWALVSEDGLVAENLSGELSIDVLSPQRCDVTISKADWTNSGGIVQTVDISLSEGGPRVVRVQSGIVISGEKSTVFDFSVSIQPGIRSLSLNLGHIRGAESVWVNISEDGWLAAGASELSDSRTITEPTIIPSVVLGVANPPVPMNGEPVRIAYTISNAGSGTAQVGVLVLTMTSSGEVLWEGSAPLVEADSSESGMIELSEWPSGTVVDVELEWRVNGEETVAMKSFPSKNQDEEGGWDIAWASLLYGAVAGIVVSAIARFVFVWRDQDPEEKARFKDERRAAREAAKKKAEERMNQKRASTEKREVACPDCEMTLRVPSDYSGQARCPACTTVFAVEAETAPEAVQTADSRVSAGDAAEVAAEEVTAHSDAEEDTSSAPQGERMRQSESLSPEQSDENKSYPKPRKESAGDAEIQKRAFSSNDEIRCPDCGQRLRVPYERRPITAKCARCECKFSAEKK